LDKLREGEEEAHSKHVRVASPVMVVVCYCC
jgi:hypothetical protein